MREYEYNFEFQYFGGIGKNEDEVRRGEGADTLTGFIANPEGLEYPPDYFKPDDFILGPPNIYIWKTSTLVGDMPLPYVLESSEDTYLITGKSAAPDQADIYKVWNSLGQAIFQISIKFSSATAPKIVEIIDFGYDLMFVTDKEIIYYDKLLDTYFTYNTMAGISGRNIPLFKTGCNFRGQLVGANVSEGQWYDLDNTREGYVFWSKIGAMDARLSEMNTAGYAKLITQKITRIKAMKNHVIVFCVDGVFALTPVVTPAPTFKITKITSYGLTSPIMVNGDEEKLLYATGPDAKGNMRLVTIDEGLKVEKLEFKTVANMNSGIGFDSLDRRWFIPSSSSINGTSFSYVYNDFGMTSINQTVQSVGHYLDPITGNLTKMVSGLDRKEASTDYSEVRTGWIDFGYSGFKTITTVEILARVLNTSTNPGLWVEIEAVKKLGIESTDTYSVTGWANKEGIFSKPIAGLRFRIIIKGFPSHLNPFKPEGIKLRFKMSDMRGMRGVYAPPPRGQYAR
jgi:hypothetical protein